MDARLTAKRAWMFSDFEPGKQAMLGRNPNDPTIHVEIRKRTADGGVAFWVINGAWAGVLYEGDEGVLHIIDERGTRHDLVYLVEVIEPECSKLIDEDFEDEVSF